MTISFSKKTLSHGDCYIEATEISSMEHTSLQLPHVAMLSPSSCLAIKLIQMFVVITFTSEL